MSSHPKKSRKKTKPVELPPVEEHQELALVERPVEEGVSLESLPKEVGVMLIVAGIGGVLLPGPVGTPFLLLGGVILFPNLFRKLDQGFQKKFPAFHQKGMKQVHRFVLDLENRYPTHH